MNPIVDLHSSVRRQSGAASVAIVLLLMLILTAAVISMMKVSGSSVIDAAKNEEQVAALFLAESGMERAQAVVSARAKAGTLTYTDAAAIVGPANLGRGSFELSATFDPVDCGPGTCNSVTIDSVGKITGTSTTRRLRSVLATQVVNNTNGCENTLTLTMPVIDNGQEAAVGALTHLAFRPKESAGTCISESPSNAEVKDCETTPGGTCDFTTDAWAVEGTGTNAISSMAAFATAPKDATTYKITTHLWKKNDLVKVLNRSFVQLGVLFYPKITNEPVRFVGRYAKAGDTEKVTGLTGTVPKTWTCQPSNTTTAGEMWRAATADLLYYGFASWPDLPTTQQLNGVTLGIQPLRQTSMATGGYEVAPGVPDGVYSQVWTSYNPRYIPSNQDYPTTPAQEAAAAAAVLPGAANGANFTGTIGATFTGTLTADGNILNVSAAGLTSGILAFGDTITSTNALCPPSGICGTVGTLRGGGSDWGLASSSYNFNKAAGIENIPSPSAMVARSNALHVVDAPTGVLTSGDSITNNVDPPTVTYGTLVGTSGDCSPTLGPGPCVFPDKVYTFTGTATQLNSTPLFSSGTTITVPSTSVTTLPAVGTAVAVASGTGAFTSVSIASGTITAGSLKDTPVGTTLCIGDALFGRQILPNTRVTGYTTATSPPGCGTGDFAVSGTTTASSDLILARTAVKGPGTASNSFTVSRQPTPRLSPGGAAVVCGGICAMLFNLDGTLGPVSGGGNSSFSLQLAGFPSGDDWASGLACLRNVDAAKIQLFGTIVAKQTKWAEVVR